MYVSESSLRRNDQVSVEQDYPVGFLNHNLDVYGEKFLRGTEETRGLADSRNYLAHTHYDNALHPRKD